MSERQNPPRRAFFEVFGVFLRLGLTSFGGPVAHLGYFRHELVERRRWMDEATYADLVALCQFLPGPASSQVGFAAGLLRGGMAGGAAAWLAFTLPSALALVAFAYGVTTFAADPGTGWLRGLKVAAAAVVADAVWKMAGALCPDRPRATVALAAAAVVLAVPHPAAQAGVILAGAGIGLLFLGWKEGAVRPGVDRPPLRVPVTARQGTVCLVTFLVLVLALPVVAAATLNPALVTLDSFFRSGALVFGGGHVVLPLLQSEVVAPGWVTLDQFLAGYGAAQAVPGPLFAFSAYLGAIMSPGPGGLTGGLWCLLAIYLPSVLLVLGALPYWAMIRCNPRAQVALMGANAAVVGLLLAAFVNPVFSAAASDGPGGLVLGLLAFCLLAVWKWPAWAVVALAGVLGGAVL